MVNYSGETGDSGELIPAGTLVMATFVIDEIKIGGAPNHTRYFKSHLVVNEGQPYAKRWIFTNVMDPAHESNSDGAKQFGRRAIQALLETNIGAHPDKPESYEIKDELVLSGMKVAVKVKIEEGKNGYPDKNDVAEWLSPINEKHAKMYEDIKAGNHGGGAPAPAQNGFAQAADPRPEPPLQEAAPADPQPGNGSGEPGWLQQANN